MKIRAAIPNSIIKPRCARSMNKVKPGEKVTSGRFLKTLKIPLTTKPPSRARRTYAEVVKGARVLAMHAAPWYGEGLLFADDMDGSPGLDYILTGDKPQEKVTSL
jgi:hypothetical protein